MSDVRRYLAEIGRRGGMKSRRSLDPETARRMVDVREARRAAKRAASSDVNRGYPADTSADAGAFQDALWRRATPAQKLASVAALSRSVDLLSRAGVRLRFPHADRDELEYQYAVVRLGPELAARVREARK